MIVTPWGRRMREEGTRLIVLLKDCEKARGESIKFPLVVTASLTARGPGENRGLNLGFPLERSLIGRASPSQWLADSGVKVSFAESLS